MSDKYQVHYITEHGFIYCGGVKDEDYMATRDFSSVTCFYCKNKSDNESELAIERSISIIKNDYYHSVNSIAEELRKMIKSGHIENSEQADEWLHETVDENYWVIYNHATRKVLLVSENADAYENFGEHRIDSCSLNTMLSKITYYALLADIREALGDIEDLFEDNEEKE